MSFYRLLPGAGKEKRAERSGFPCPDSYRDCFFCIKAKERAIPTFTEWQTSTPKKHAAIPNVRDEPNQRQKHKA